MMRPPVASGGTFHGTTRTAISIRSAAVEPPPNFRLRWPSHQEHRSSASQADSKSEPVERLVVQIVQIPELKLLPAPEHRSDPRHHAFGLHAARRTEERSR